mgnify:CR=1 FL=1
MFLCLTTASTMHSRLAVWHWKTTHQLYSSQMHILVMVLHCGVCQNWLNCQKSTHTLQLKHTKKAITQYVAMQKQKFVSHK